MSSSAPTARGSSRTVGRALACYESLRRGRMSKIQAMARSNGRRFHLPDGPEQQARDAALATSFGISPEIDWLYGRKPPVPGPALRLVS